MTHAFVGIHFGPLHFWIGPIMFRRFTVDPGGWSLYVGRNAVCRFGRTYGGKGNGARWSVQWRGRVRYFGTAR